MRAKSLITLIIIVVLVGLLGFVIVNGLTVGIYNFRPLSGIQQGLDITGGVYTVYQANDTNIEDFETKMEGTMSVLRTRLDSKGFTEATITRQGSDRIRIEIPINDSSEITDPNEISQYIGSPAKLQFVDPNGTVILEGDDIVSAKAVIGEDNEPVVSFQLSDAGADAFGEATKEFIGQQIAIQLDGETISAPTVQAVIAGGSGIIEGDFTEESAMNLALQIESGALPLELTELEVRSMSATLGEGALSNSVLAGIIGFFILLVFMIVLYRVPGISAIIALVLYIELVLLLIGSVPGVQLTLPGIAGIILGIGMAVDANVIMFERFKEEVWNGKSLRVAQKYSFNKAFITILDSNITTLICAIVLAVFGTGTIKSFAYTLIISIGVSMFTALVVTRGLLKLLINMKKDQNKVSLFVPKRRGGAAQ